MAHKITLVVWICLLPLCFQSSSALVSLSQSSSNSLFTYTAAPAQKQLHKCYPPDRDALLEVAAFFSTRAHSYFGLLFWSPEQDCCSWPGVTCGPPLVRYSTTSNNSGHPMKTTYSRVVELTLSDIFEITNARFSFPLAICRLSALMSLDLSGNDLNGPIPACLGHNLISLQTLNLGSNSLSEFETGSNFGANLSLLTHLDLSYNSFTSMPSIIGGNLTYLDLSDNALSGKLVSALKLHMPRLQFLDLTSNSLSGSISFISGLSSLQYLYLSYNAFNISLTPAVFSSTPLIRQLSLLEAEQITGEIQSLEQLQQLESLELSYVLVPASSLTSLLCKLGSLQSISVTGFANGKDVDYGSVLNDKLCEKPASANQLTSLDLISQGYIGPFPTWFADFTQLQALDLSYNQFEGSIPPEWQALTHLTHLYLSSDSLASNSKPVCRSEEVQISSLFRLPLESLVLRSMGLTSQDFPCTSFSYLNQTLQVLDLANNHISPGQSLMHCLHYHNFSFLLTLSLSNNPLALPLHEFLSFPQNSIQELDLSFCQLSGSLSGIEMLAPSSHINLAHNNLSGSIPSDIGSRGLFQVDLSYNELAGLVPSSIWNLTSPDSGWYNQLVLDNNHLQGELAPTPRLAAGLVSVANNYLSKASFHNVSTLEVLDLSGNQLSGNLESLLGDYSVMRDLLALLLGGNHLSGSIPDFLGTSAPSLISLELSDNKLTGAIPHSLRHLQALHSKVSEEMFGSFTYTLESVKNVKSTVQFSHSRGHLDLSSNQLNGTIPDGLGALIGLNDLNLSRNQFSGPIPLSLAHLISLESLDLSFNNLQGSIPPELLQLYSLEVFNVSFNPELSGRIPEGPQLETAASYKGDSKLCGQAIHRDCGEQKAVVPPIEPNTQKLGTKKRSSIVVEWIEEWTAIPGILLGYVLGLGLTIWALKLLHFYK